MKHLTVPLGARAYPIWVGDGALARLPDTLMELEARGAVGVVSDANVAPLYAERVLGAVRDCGLRAELCVLPAGEEHKRLEHIESLCGRFLEAGLDRSSLVVALGGGIVGDMAGFAAACFMRGIGHVQIPTTIVAQVDSSVGGKTAVNHPLAKNIIGAFHQPSAVLVDLSLLASLPDRELRAGLAEAIKHGVIADEALFRYMEEHVDALLAKDVAALEYPVVRSCEIKSAVVAADEREQGLRANLNYGHTFGHGIEAVTHYRKYLHGEAVALGMHAAGALARDLDLVGEDFVERQRACLKAYGLPVAWDALPVADTLAAMRRDKKVRAGTMKFVVADRMGHVVHRTDITEAQAQRALEALTRE
ncbi:MAG: 3-dehydroquinate synthase [Candidatus Hydrogenedentes bacterium]|nr:3-dehydroquinate synthase [Candidatus Hydrogenedentota bacterium]